MYLDAALVVMICLIPSEHQKMYVFNRDQTMQYALLQVFQ